MDGYAALWVAIGLVVVTAYGAVVAVGVVLNVAAVLLSLQDAGLRAADAAAEQSARRERALNARLSKERTRTTTKRRPNLRVVG